MVDMTFVFVDLMVTIWLQRPAKRGGSNSRRTNGTKHKLSPDERLDVFNALEKLDVVMLPFAPHRPPFGTLGKWVDMTTAKYELGDVLLLQPALAEVTTNSNCLCA